MKTRIVFAFLAAGAGSLVAQSSTPDQVIQSFRVKPKPGKSQELEKALVAHAEQYHKGDHAWRIFRVMTGEDSGMLHITEGTTTFGRLEERGDLGAAHMAHYTNSVIPLVAATGPERISRVLSDYGTTAPTTPAKKVLMRYTHPKPGEVQLLLAQIKLLKPVWEKLGQEVVVYQTFYSGEPRIATARRLKNGFKDLAPDDSKKFSATFDSIHGAGAFEKFLSKIASHTTRVEETVLEFVAWPNRN